MSLQTWYIIVFHTRVAFLSPFSTSAWIVSELEVPNSSTKPPAREHMRRTSSAECVSR